MGRHGYSEDLDTQDFNLWRGRVASAIRGKRGQALLRDLRDALDAMPDKRLISGEIVRDGDVCALGAVGVKRCVSDLDCLDPEDHDYLGEVFNVAPCLVQEIEFENDENGGSPTQRWEWMRKWVEKNIREPSEPSTPAVA